MMTDEELIGLLCKDEVFRRSIEEQESKRIDEIVPNWKEMLLEFVFDDGEVTAFDLGWIIKTLRRAGYEREYLQ